MRACYAHLNSKQINQDGSTSSYYTKVENHEIKEAETKLQNVLEEALNNNIISEKEFSKMIPENKKVAKFYMTFEVHKEHEANMQWKWFSL